MAFCSNLGSGEDASYFLHRNGRNLAHVPIVLNRIHHMTTCSRRGPDPNDGAPVKAVPASPPLLPNPQGWPLRSPVRRSARCSPTSSRRPPRPRG